jgi:hypothetical protein
LPDSVDEWLAKVAEHEATAKLLVRKGSPDAARALVMHHAGSAIEYALKAAIMKREGLNRWPDQNAPGGYWTHDLTKLRRKAGLTLAPTDPVSPSWQTLVVWTRTADYTYSPNPTPLSVARSYVEAAFGQNGVVTWIRSKLT